MKRLLIAVACAVAFILAGATQAQATVNPVSQTDADGYDHTTAPDTFTGVDMTGKAGSFGVYADQSQSQYDPHSFDGSPLPDVKVQVKPYVKKQVDGTGWIMTQVNADTWKNGTNPATSDCMEWTSDINSGYILLYKLDSAGHDLGGPVWDRGPFVLCNGDGGHEEFLGGTQTFTFNSPGFRVQYTYRHKTDQGHDFDGKTQTKRISTGFASWKWGCGGTWNLDYCDEYFVG